MGNQHHPHGKAFKVLLETGLIGDVTEVVCWTDRPGRFWPPAPKSYPTTGKYDRGFTKESWDIWLGPCAEHPCSPLIAPFKWRGWWDYGTGAIGDMAIHNADPAFEILGWNAPIAVKGICDDPVVAAFPGRAKIELTFAPTPKCPRAVKFTWMNDSQTPPLPAGVHPKYAFGDNGLMFVGTKGAFNGVVWSGGNPLVIAADHEWNAETKAMQRSVFTNPGVWFLALASGFMYVARYAVNGWGTLVLEGKGFSTAQATMIISVNAWCGIFGTVLSGFLSDKLFKGDRQLPALVAGILHVISIIIFLYGGDSVAINVVAMIIRGLAIGVLICFLGGLMAVDIVPRNASGTALGIVGLVSYIFASTQDIVSGVLIDKGTSVLENGEKVIDFGPVGFLWIGSALISLILPLFIRKRKQQEIA
jgi:hypothetical protein